jgi:CBS domain-containing protein
MGVVSTRRIPSSRRAAKRLPEVIAVDYELNVINDSLGQANPTKPLCVSPDSTVDHVLRLLKKHNSGSVLICQNEVLVGIFTERDALRIMADGTDLDTPIERVMVRDPATLSASDPIGTAIRMMSSGGYRRLPIVDDTGKPVGVVKVSGILHYLVAHFPNVVYNLPPTPHYIPQEREGA